MSTSFLRKTPEEQTGAELIATTLAVTSVALVAPYVVLVGLGTVLLAKDSLKKRYRKRFPKK